ERATKFARKIEFRERNQRWFACPVLNPKIFLFLIFVNRAFIAAVPRQHRGALRPIVTKRGSRDANGRFRCRARGLRADERHLADGQVGWSWRPWAGAKRADWRCRP